MMRPLWTAMGLISLAVGAIGVLLPLLPTTPLVILAAFCFAKGSPRLEQMLESHRSFGPMIADWRSKGAIARRHKATAVVMMAVAFGIALALNLPLMALGFQALCLLAAAAFVLSRPEA